MRSSLVMDLGPSVDRRRDSLQPRLELEREEAGIVPRLGEVAAVEPQSFLRRRLPHVAQFAFPWAGILGGAGTEAPHLADLVRDLGRDQRAGPLIHRAVAR